MGLRSEVADVRGRSPELEGDQVIELIGRGVGAEAVCPHRLQLERIGVAARRGGLRSRPRGYPDA